MVVLLFVIYIGEFEAKYDHSDVRDNSGAEMRWLCDPHKTKGQHNVSIVSIVLSLQDVSCVLEPAPRNQKECNDAWVDQTFRPVVPLISQDTDNSPEESYSESPSLAIDNDEASDCRPHQRVQI